MDGNRNSDNKEMGKNGKRCFPKSTALEKGDSRTSQQGLFLEAKRVAIPDPNDRP